MKKTNSFAHKFLAGAVALAMFALISQASADTVPQQVTVIKVEGHARVTTDGKGWNDIKYGDVIPIGGVIQTAEHSKVVIMMGKERTGTAPQPIDLGASPISASGAGAGGADTGPKANTVTVYEMSVLAIDKLTLEKTGMDEVSETQLDLRAGKIMGNVKKLSSASRYEVKIPNGVAGIRGTTYVIGASGNIIVVDGQVIISYVDSGTQQVVTKTINAGQQFNPFTSPPNSTPTAADPGVLRDIQNQLTHNGTNPLPPTSPQDYTKDTTVVHISVN